MPALVALAAPAAPAPPALAEPDRRASRADGMRLSLLRGFSVRADAGDVVVPTRAQRVIALLALHGGRLRRSYVAGMLWPEVTRQRANASLRSALWSLPKSSASLVAGDSESIGLADHVEVDLVHAQSSARMVLAGEPGCAGVDDELFTWDLLPDWYEDWVLIEQEQFRQLRLHALEALATLLTEHGQFGRAIALGMAAVSCEPLRESAHRVLIRTHLAEGNRSEAVRQYHVYLRLARDELGLTPSNEMERLHEDALRVG